MGVEFPQCSVGFSLFRFPCSRIYPSRCKQGYRFLLVRLQSTPPFYLFLEQRLELRIYPLGGSKHEAPYQCTSSK